MNVKQGNRKNKGVSTQLRRSTRIKEKRGNLTNGARGHVAATKNFRMPKTSLPFDVKKKQDELRVSQVLALLQTSGVDINASL
jgi:hypothetical protein